MSSLRPIVPHHLLQAECFYHSSLAQSARPVFHHNRRFHASPTRGRLGDLPIVAGNLTETLEAHRYANRQRLIRWIPCKPAGDRNAVAIGPAPSVRRVPRPRQSLPATERSVQESSELGLELLHPSSKKLRPDIRPHAAISLFRKLMKKSSARVSRKEWSSSDAQYPWLDYLESSKDDGLSRLDDEVNAFENYMSHIPQEQAAVNKVITEVEEILLQEDHPQPLVIGSRRTGLAMRHSNIDLLVMLSDPDGLFKYRGPSPTRPKIAELQLERQEQISRLLRGAAKFSSVVLVRSRIPKVIATHAATGLPVTIHCGTQLPTSLEFTQSYYSEFPTLRPLLATIRMILEQRNLFGPQNRGISTYGLTMMIIAALKLSEGKYSRTSTAEQLLHVLRFYSTVDFHRYGISVDPPSIFRKCRHLRESSKLVESEAPYIRGQISIGKRSAKLAYHILCLQDPANYMNDLGMEAFRTFEIQEVFGDVYADLRAAVKAWDREWNDSLDEIASEEVNREPSVELITAKAIRDSDDKKAVSMLQFALGGDYERLERIRDKVILGAGS
ncbi:hypothetical protein D8B26_001228 [Coccidioides posadasii str. Silveira]|uniref:uncharacterized protein n=1 Tax=Coccidioides posadasii (strain RMSCC 757 / Silveira) TaxID=443226 RepID=UPI001BEF5850|nr:hypothetical protein D8B26_001228 [Coccidioides posadasii str. Silveira]